MLEQLSVMSVEGRVIMCMGEYDMKYVACYARRWWCSGDDRILAGFVLVGRKCLRRIDLSVHGDMVLIRSDCAMWGR